MGCNSSGASHGFHRCPARERRPPQGRALSRGIPKLAGVPREVSTVDCLPATFDLPAPLWQSSCVSTLAPQTLLISLEPHSSVVTQQHALGSAGGAAFGQT
mmetsp:Transcript_16187/g.41267  ORF Transcript_16187/g.41267 Transcript_16187/m.41267 type:complete len:101 (+) Transcript_16187:2026-2328(+)